MTYSIAAYDRRSGAFGIAVASCVPAVGAAVPFVSLRGAIATQARFHHALGADGLTGMERGQSVEEVLRELLRGDPAPELRQVHGVDGHGGSYAHTGEAAKDWKGSLLRPHSSIAGNTLTGPEVLDAMDEAFSAAAEEELSDRLLRALLAGDQAGGDRRGRQSAALLIAAPEGAFHHNLRVDDHADPVAELLRIHDLARERGAERSARPRHVPLRLKW